MTLPNGIALRPRFQLLLKEKALPVLELFRENEDPPFLIKSLGQHVFIKFNKTESNFWTPQLQFEIVDYEEGQSKLYGLFGPNPTLWTFFMFIHFIIATLIIVMGIWAYSGYALGHSYTLQIGLIGLMVVLWVALYVFGRWGKKKGRHQMEHLHNYLIQRLCTYIT
ncbi:GTP-binding protein [Arenibacter lacus]|uniref:GTP-binding protein n=1 Tax=Arenibacter lacus TaxID=2608629 RepID=UPI00168C0BCA|nr:GTP-binding protein [Arenibacter lacus]